MWRVPPLLLPPIIRIAKLYTVLVAIILAHPPPLNPHSPRMIFQFVVEDDDSKFYSYSGPPMNIARSSPTAISIGGNIYVFGGQHPDQHGSHDLWAESLDTTDASPA